MFLFCFYNAFISLVSIQLLIFEGTFLDTVRSQGAVHHQRFNAQCAVHSLHKKRTGSKEGLYGYQSWREKFWSYFIWVIKEEVEEPMKTHPVSFQ